MRLENGTHKPDARARGTKAEKAIQEKKKVLACFFPVFLKVKTREKRLPSQGASFSVSQNRRPAMKAVVTLVIDFKRDVPDPLFKEIERAMLTHLEQM